MPLLLGRVVSNPTVHATAAAVSLPVAVAGMHAAGFSTNPDTAALANGALQGTFWLVLGITALFGGLGGVVAELLSLRGHIELPHRVKRLRAARGSRLGNPRYEIDLGVLSRVLLGAAAGLALLAIYAPTSSTALVVNALIAGSTATGVFRLVQGRLLGQAPAVRGKLSATSEEAKSSQNRLSVVPEMHSPAA